MTPRTVKKQHPSIRDDIGDLKTIRPLPGPGLPHLDPFLFLNHHGPQIYPPRNRGLPFGPHPHRGFETVTFVLDGELAHRDSAGHESVIHAGGVQWMTAGSGLVHAEISPPGFMQRGGALEILQLWVNLPGRLKMTPPRYVGLEAAQIPSLPSDDGRAVVHLVSGDWGGRTGPIASLTDVHLMTVDLAPGGRVRLPAPPDQTVFLYVVRGDLAVGGRSVSPFNLVELADDGDAVELGATSDARVLFGHALPLREPIVSYGPFVMNSTQEIEQAIRDYQAGKFGVPV
jgi:redox-sensitive bicupin YhaK (pirin superfamily)